MKWFSLYEEMQVLTDTPISRGFRIFDNYKTKLIVELN